MPLEFPPPTLQYDVTYCRCGVTLRLHGNDLGDGLLVDVSSPDPDTGQLLQWSLDGAEIDDLMRMLHDVLVLIRGGRAAPSE